MTAMRYLLLILVCTGHLWAESRNYVATDNGSTLFSSQAVTTGTVTSSAYRLSVHEYVAIEIAVTNLASTETITLTPIYDLQAGSANLTGYAVPDGAGNAITLTEGTDDLRQIREVVVVNGARRLYFTATTSDGTGCTLSLQAAGQ